MFGGFEPRPYAEMVAEPCGRDVLPAGSYRGGAGGTACGDFVQIGLAVEDRIVTGAGFTADACSPAIAAASVVVEAIVGRPVLAAALIGEDMVDHWLGGLRPATRHAARLAAGSLHRALSVAARDRGLILAAPDPARALVAMSGGVDSGVAALISQKRGDSAVGVTLQLWDDPNTDGEESCCSPEAVAGARRLAHSLGIPHLTLDLRDEFREVVVNPYLEAFEHGLTPNPCVGCNGHVRFDALDELRERLGARALLTGHYARLEDDGKGPLLRPAAYDRKDQTYMLAALSQERLRTLEFPLGALTKPEVRELARGAGLPVAEKRESQDLCFIAGIGREGFLELHARNENVRDARPGEIVTCDGKVVGEHQGAHRFTVGQRRGLRVGAPEPLYVLAVDTGTNRVVVGPKNMLASDRVSLRGVRLLRPSGAVNRIKLRYRSEASPCAFTEPLPTGTHRSADVSLGQPVDGVAPGQIACLMHDELVVGWATIVRGQGGAVAAAVEAARARPLALAV